MTATAHVSPKETRATAFFRLYSTKRAELALIHDDGCRDCSGFEKTGFVVLYV